MRHPLIALSLALVLLAPSLGGQQQPSFRSSTTLVQVDVIVRAKKGFVADLHRDDFQVLEDGVPQRIDLFYLIADADLDAESPWTPDPTASEPPPADQTGGRGGRVFILVFDQPHLAFGNGRRARDAALAFLRDRFRPGDVGGVVVGRAMANRRLTSDRSELVAAVRAVQPSYDAIALNKEYYQDWPRFRDAYEMFTVWKRDADMTEVAVSRALSEGPAPRSSAQAAITTDPTAANPDVERREATTQLVVSKAQNGVDEFRRTTRETLDILKTLMTGLGKLEGRKTVVVLSDGFVVEEALAPLREVEAAAARSDVRIYAIDTRSMGMGTVDNDVITATQPEADFAPHTNPDIVFDGLSDLASATGGYAVSRRNDLVDAIAGIDRDTSSFYVLGYRPSESKADGRFRKIEVRVKRPGVQVRARRGYIADTARIP